ncbi:hypothetical protein [Gordonia sp. i37]|uniref:hypothetical protein n=1 Tax=Gordonia sp. i37 TaxID=1961707 RepID=UPI0009AEA31A|nr:hypothetical protein [Gordonia sp. i37]OPX14964.1 hypothetical protein B1964_12335 [Gordonia sp. i37]
MTTTSGRRLSVSWAIAIALTLATLIGILIVTRDLSISNDIFKDGVVQANKVDHTTDRANDGSAQLPPADDAINQGLPQVFGVIDSLNQANGTLATLATDLQSLGTALEKADPSLVSIIGSAGEATSSASGATGQVGEINTTLVGANTRVQNLGTLLDRTQELSTIIDSKLRIALLLPKFPK